MCQLLFSFSAVGSYAPDGDEVRVTYTFEVGPVESRQRFGPDHAQYLKITDEHSGRNGYGVRCLYTSKRMLLSKAQYCQHSTHLFIYIMRR